MRMSPRLLRLLLFKKNPHIPKGISEWASCARKAALLTVVCLVIASLTFLSGCKFTDVLTEHVEDPENGILDPKVEPLYKENPKAPEDPQRSSHEVKDTTRTDLQEEKIPVYDPNAPKNGQAILRIYDKNSPYNFAATEGTLVKQEEKKKKSEKTEKKETREKKSDSKKTNKTKKKSESKKSGGESEDTDTEGNMKISAGIGGTGTVYDASAKSSKLPEKCDKVAAAGPYATIVEMLCGKGGLVACDSYWKSQVSSRGLFPNEGVSSLATAWKSSSNGSYTLDVDALIKAEPDAVLVDGETIKLSSAQQSKLSKAKIDIITVPSLGDSGTSDSEVTSAVKIVGELLKNSTAVEYSSQDAASKYLELHDEVIDMCLSANGGYATKTIGSTSFREIFQNGTDGNGKSTSRLSSSAVTVAFVDSWASTNKSSVTADRNYAGNTLYLDGEKMDVASGVGLSASVANGDYALIDYYFQVSGVMNNAYDTAKPSKGNSGSSSRFVVIPGTTPSSEKSYLNTSNVGSRMSTSALWYPVGTPSSDSDTGGVGMITAGDSIFPGVIARSSEIAKKIVASANKSNGVYNTGQSYKVWVMPSGIDGSWSTGTAESFLSCLWTMKNIMNAGGASSTCDKTVNSYYQLFYRCAASSGTGKVSNYSSSYTASCPTS